MPDKRVLDLSFTGRTLFGPGAVREIGNTVAGLQASRAFIVTDSGVLASGVVDEVLGSLKGRGIGNEVFDGVTPNPTIADLEAGSAALRRFGVADTVVVAVGGGSGMDAAKGISLHAVNGGKVEDLDYRNVPEHPGLPLVAAPTTSGTGSETNGFGVITDPSAGRKFYVGHESVKPRISILDPELTLGLPPAATAATGLDALTHALEAIMSRSANPYADALALQAVRMVAGWLPGAVRNGTDGEARAQMLLAAHLAGLAFSSGTGLGLCHAIAHPLGARAGVIHGMALAAMLPRVMEFNLPASGDKLALVATAFGGSVPRATPEEDARAAVTATAGLIDEVLAAGAMQPLEVPGDLLTVLVRDALDDGVMANTPRYPSAREVEGILASVL